MDSKQTKKDILSYEVLKKITKLIKDSTQSSKPPDRKALDRLTEMCRCNPGYVHHAFSRIMVLLKENHSEIRLNCVYLCDNMFSIFPTFRDLLTDAFDSFFASTFGPGFNQDLPEPKDAAIRLVQVTIKCVDQWHLKYGGVLKKLDEAYIHLKNARNVDFKTLEIYDPVERAKRLAEEQAALEINIKLLKQMDTEMKSLVDDINDAIKSFNSCLGLIIPPPENFTSNDIHVGESEEDLRLHGVHSYSKSSSIEIYLNSCSNLEIVKTADNSYLLENCKDIMNLVQKKYLPKTKAWHVLLEKTGASKERIRKALELAQNLECIVSKYSKLNFVDESSVLEEEVSTDSELEEVEEEKPPETVLAKKSVEMERNFLEAPSESSEKPTSSKKNPKAPSYPERKQKLLSVAPKLPFSMDLYHWEDDGPKTQTLLPTSIDGHQFWASSSVESIEVPAESIHSRVIEFSGKFEPVTRACSAPLPSGKLCPRHDRYKCPLHGVIVPRDEKGNIINPDDEKLVKPSTSNSNEVPDWQDPKLLAELKASTGLDLEIKKGKRMTQGKSKLTEIRRKLSSKEKLAKKVFNKKSLKRVANTLDRLDYKRYRDKFGDQFNYSHNS